MDVPQWLKDIPPFASAIIAILALIVSLANTLINWRNLRRDTHKILVKLQWNAEIVYVTTVHSPIKQRLAHITVTNKGRRPAYISFVGLQLPDRPNAINWLDNGVKLDEGDASITVKVAQDSTLEPYLKQWQKIFASVSDNTGRSYKSKGTHGPPIIVPGIDLQTAIRLQDMRVANRKQINLQQT